jgi:hypothetical protein
MVFLPFISCDGTLDLKHTGKWYNKWLWYVICCNFHFLYWLLLLGLYLTNNYVNIQSVFFVSLIIAWHILRVQVTRDQLWIYLICSKKANKNWHLMWGLRLGLRTGNKMLWIIMRGHII